MKKIALQNNITLHCQDALELLQSLDDSSIDMIATDPPYFRVKDEAWDNQWPDEAAFLGWMDAILLECWRVLKPAGSLYLFCGSKLAAETELLVKQRFHLLNHIIWAKPTGRWQGASKVQLRSFFPATERILFAEHYGSDGHAKGCSGYTVKTRALRQKIFSPLIDYFRESKAALGISSAAIDAATGTKMSGHWFGYSQWQLPSETQYRQLQTLFSQQANKLGKPYADLTDQYQELTQEYQQLVRTYDELKQEYEALRRPFRVSAEVPYTDVWTFKPVAYYPGKHPCEKPADLLTHLLLTSTRPGQTVLDPFMGSGSMGKACIQSGRGFIGGELDAKRFDQTRQEIMTTLTHHTTRQTEDTCCD